jgi:hypothetical protein
MIWIKRIATAEAVGATVQKERDFIEKVENMHKPTWVIRTPAKESREEVDTERPEEFEKGAERCYPSRKRNLSGKCFQKNMADKDRKHGGRCANFIYGTYVVGGQKRARKGPGHKLRACKLSI